MLYALATNLHWSERDILAMRWDRIVAYADEIKIDLGEHPDRMLPELAEEADLARVMRDEYAKQKGHQNGSANLTDH